MRGKANIWGKANIRGLMIECIILFTGRWANNWAGGVLISSSLLYFA